METSIIISGFGGQGVLLAGQLLAYAGMDNGRQVTWIPSYGPEMRGGTAHCVVIISDEAIGTPMVARPDIAIALNQPSMAKYEPLVRRGGLLVANSNLLTTHPTRADIDILLVPASEMAEEAGSVKMLNMAAVGAMLGLRPILPLAVVEQALRDHLPTRKANLLQSNIDLLHAGYAMGQIQEMVLREAVP